MNRRTLVVLLTALAVLVALAVAVSFSQRRPPSTGGLLLPDLKARLNDLEKIVVRTAGDEVVATLERRESGWVVGERNGYAADLGRIRKNLIALAEARILEEKTSNPELYDRLGVDDVEKDNAGGVQLDLTGSGTTTSVVIGNTGVGGGDRAYARRAGEAASWLVSGDFDAPRETAQWLDRGMTAIDTKRVQSVTITHPDGGVLRVERKSADETDFSVAGVPAGRELSFPSVGNSVGGALSDLEFESVEPAATFAPGDVAPVLARFETFDGLVVEVRTWKVTAGPRVRISASADPALAERSAPKSAAPETKTDSSAGSKEPVPPPQAADARKPFDEVEAEAERLNARLGDWVYTLPEFKGEQLVKTLENMLQPRPPGKL